MKRQHIFPRTHGPITPALRVGRRACWTLFGVLLIPLLLLIWTPGQAHAADEANKKDTCIQCHADSGFMVKDKKLYDYFQEWKLSVHANTSVSCADCHGGNPNAMRKKNAHGPGPLSASSSDSPTNYRNIPATCGKCHKEEVKHFQESEHFAHLAENEDGEQGPTCVTCHGSINTSVLKVSTVRQTCEKCHDEKTEGEPSVPDQAEAILGNFLSIQRYYRYIALRDDPVDAQNFFKLVDPMIKRLSADWHSFELERVEQQTTTLVDFLKGKRNEILQNKKAGGKLKKNQ